MNVREILFTLSLFSGVFVSAASILAEDWQQSPYMPGREHYEAVDAGTNCSIYRSLQAEAKVKITQNREMIKAELRSLEDARKDLDQCASDRGVSLSGGKQEVLIAELCPLRYQSWLKPSYKVRLLAEDLKEAYQTSRVMGTRLRHFCAALPEPKVVPLVEERSASAEKTEALTASADLVEEIVVDDEIDDKDLKHGADVDAYPLDDGFEFVEIAKRQLGGF
ncbi:MAG: hypothetical protein R3B54_05525 [Bdellovibrionota bacterium]